MTASTVHNQATFLAPGKAILVGEHAVVYGARAIAFPLSNCELKLEFKLSSNIKSSFEFGPTPIDQCLLNLLLDRAHKYFEIKRQQYHIKASSSLPIGAGVGSSAALAVTLTKGVAHLNQITCTEMDIACAANYLEETFHGKPSGLDASVVAYGCPIVFSPGQPPQKIDLSKLKHKFSFVIADSGERTPTKSMIEKARPYFSQDRMSKVEHFNRICDLTLSGLTNGDERKVAEGMQKASLALEKSGVATQTLKKIQQKMALSGCIASKLTGAGGGGCLIGLLPAQKSEQVAENLRKHFAAQQLHFFNLPPAKQII